LKSMVSCLKVSLRIDLAKNNIVGKWTIKDRELASGMTCEQILEVTP